MRLVSPSNFSAGLLKDANDWRKGTTTTRKSKGHMIYICVLTAAATLNSLARQSFVLRGSDHRRDLGSHRWEGHT